MKLGDITEVGFYREVGGEDLWECFENEDSDEDFRKEEPLLLDEWLYQYTDSDDRKVYECHGLLYHIGRDYSDLEVEKVDQAYEISGSMGHVLTEKKPTYKEKYEDLLSKFEAWKQISKPTGICETCTHKALKENDKLRSLIKGVLEYCEDQDFKHDFTACAVLEMLEGGRNAS